MNPDELQLKIEERRIEDSILYLLGPGRDEESEFAAWLWKTFGEPHARDWMKRYTALRIIGNFAPDPIPSLEEMSKQIQINEENRLIAAQARREMDLYFGRTTLADKAR